MKKEDFDKEMLSLDKIHKSKCNELRSKFAMANNKVSLGDIISGQGTRINVFKIVPTITFGGDYPECLYKGIKLRKDNTPFKNGDSDTIYQSRIEEHIKN